MPTRIHTDSELLELQHELGVDFSDRGLLRQALTHESFLNEWSSEELSRFSAESNQRLEFLGDSVLNFTVAEILYRRLPNADEGTLSLARSHVVRKETLAQASRRADIGKHIVFGQGESRGGLAERESVLEDAYEALVGALFLDRGVAAAESFIAATLGDVIDRVSTEGVEKDSKSTFQELVQAEGFRSPRYRTEQTHSSDDSEIRYTSIVTVAGHIAGQGDGTSKSKAEQNAARVALESFSDGIPANFRTIKTSDEEETRVNRTPNRRRIHSSVGKPIEARIDRDSDRGLVSIMGRALNFGARGLSWAKTSPAKRIE